MAKNAPMPDADFAQATTTVGAPHSAEQLLAAGKHLREKVTRKSQGAWKAAKGRRNPLEILAASDAERISELVPIRYGRMLQSPFTFYRGAAAVMAADLAATPTTGVRVQACGDCHLMNFGGFATPERNLVFDINDFDETLPAPWEWDVKRLVASFVLGARSIGLREQDGRDAAEACARSYRKRLREFAEMHPLELWYTRIGVEEFLGAVEDEERKSTIRGRIAKATEQRGSEIDYPKLAGLVGGQIRIQDDPPLIFHPESTHAPEFEALVQEMVTHYRGTLHEERRVLLDQYRYVDAAIKVVGIGSVGRHCWIVLLMSASNDPLFLQFKQAVESVLEPYAGKSAHPNHGQRVVAGQRLMQAASDVFLGWTSGPQRDFYVRQLRDAKIKPLIETFGSGTLTDYAKACGWALARAHAKSGDALTISGYLGTSGSFDEAMGSFAVAYADQTERDHAALKSAVRAGSIRVHVED
jgi:uncharacterized protein (DUF2252 family)